MSYSGVFDTTNTDTDVDLVIHLDTEAVIDLDTHIDIDFDIDVVLKKIEKDINNDIGKRHSYST